MKTEVKNILCTDSRPDFDRACAMAYDRATENYFKENGQCKLTRFHRSDTELKVSFSKLVTIGSMINVRYEYHFEAWLETIGSE